MTTATPQIKSFGSATGGRSNAVCSCGAATCIRTSCVEANPGRRFFCCRLIPSMLSTNRENAELKLLKAKEVVEKGVEVQRIKFLLCFSWLFFVICVLIWICMCFLLLL
ncbi:hypothetical protein Hanom_Chr05g00427421 [Helianthus anomalus]